MSGFWKIISIITIVALVPFPVLAEMSSTNYTIYADSVGLGGGEYSTSTNYSLNDTIADNPGGETTSTSYYIYGGYQGAELTDTLTVSYSSNGIALGTLSSAAVSSASTEATISTNSITGFSLSVSAVSGSMPAAVSDGSVTAGSEEYGMAVSGNYAAFADDQSVIVGRTLASHPYAVNSVTTTITFKASMAESSTAGSYSQTVTLTASANF